MLEKELKIIEVDIDRISSCLYTFGVDKIFEGYIYDVYFDTNDSFLDNNGSCVRLRFKGNKCILAFKKKKKHSKLKVMLEIEFEIVDIVGLIIFLMYLGLVPYRVKSKKRISFLCNNSDTQFDFDMYDGIPPLLEIESCKKKNIYKWIKKLDLDDHKKMKFGSRGLLRYYNVGMTDDLKQDFGGLK